MKTFKVKNDQGRFLVKAEPTAVKEGDMCLSQHTKKMCCADKNLAEATKTAPLHLVVRMY